MEPKTKSLQDEIKQTQAARPNSTKAVIGGGGSFWGKGSKGAIAIAELEEEEKEESVRNDPFSNMRAGRGEF